MTSDGSVSDRVRRWCRDALVDAGFRKRSGEIYTREIGEGVLGWLGLNSAANRPQGPFEINPVIGVRHQELEKLVAELAGRKPHSSVPATLSISLGYVGPEARYQAWVFDGGTEDEARAEQLVAAVERDGRQFMDRHSTLESIVAVMRQGTFGIRDHAVPRIPVGLQLLDQPAEARDQLDTSVAELGERADLAAQALRDFATAFTERFGDPG